MKISQMIVVSAVLWAGLTLTTLHAASLGLFTDHSDLASPTNPRGAACHDANPASN